MNWQPIDTAPRSEGPLLTDCGIAVFQPYWNSRPEWALCDYYGDPFDCADNGLFYCNPKIWQPLPELP